MIIIDMVIIIIHIDMIIIDMNIIIFDTVLWSGTYLCEVTVTPTFFALAETANMTVIGNLMVMIMVMIILVTVILVMVMMIMMIVAKMKTLEFQISQQRVQL